MKLSDSTTWGVPIESIEIDDPTWGRVEIKRWSQFHFYDSANHPMEIILIQRKGKGLSKKAAKPMWLAWIGLEKLSLEARTVQPQRGGYGYGTKPSRAN